MKLDIAINYVCSWLFFYVSILKQAHDPLKTLKLKTLASDYTFKNDVMAMPLLIYYDELYMLHPLISALILDT